MTDWFTKRRKPVAEQQPPSAQAGAQYMSRKRDKREVIVETRNLAMHFGGVRAVDQVDFTLYDKELRCLIGPNGAGKSTFFKCLTGQLTPTSGEVIIRGHDTTRAETHEIAGPWRWHQNAGSQPV